MVTTQRDATVDNPQPSPKFLVVKKKNYDQNKDAVQRLNGSGFLYVWGQCYASYPPLSEA